MVHYPVFGGPHNEQLRMNRALQQRGVVTTMLLPDERGNAVDRLRSGGVDVVTMPLHRLRASRDPRLHTHFLRGLLPEVRRIEKLIGERNIDVVVIGGVANPHAAIAARRAGIPICWQIVDTAAPRLVRAVMVPVVKQLADAILVNGKELVQFHFGSTKPNIPSFVYYPPVDTSVFHVSPGRRLTSRRELGIPADAQVVGMVANITPMKGIEYFIRTAALVFKAQPDSWFFHVGPRYDTHRAYFERLQSELQSTGIPRERFIFTGARSDVENLYPAMDVKLITSVPHSEGTPTTVMEAMACGVPVVATNVGAVKEVVEHNVTGLIVPPLDPNALAAATLSLLEDVSLRKQMGASGRMRAVERFDVEVCAETQIRSFEAAVAHAASHRRAG